MPPLLLLGLVAMFLVARNAQSIPKAAKGTTARGISPDVALAINPTGFPVPSVGVGDFVKLIFLSGRDREHMWVRVTSTGAGNGPHVGILSNEPKVPSLRRSLQYGQPITFSSDNVEVRVRAGDFMKGAQFGLKMG